MDRQWHLREYESLAPSGVWEDDSVIYLSIHMLLEKVLVELISR